MKRVLFTLLFVGLIGSTQSASAQFSLGVVGVLNLSNLSIESEGITGTLGGTGLGGGFVAEFQVRENVAVSLQPMYLNKGAGLKLEDVSDLTNIFGASIETALDLGYIEVPVLVKYYFTDDFARPYIVAGPSIGFLSKAEFVVNIDGQEQTEDLKEDFEDIDLSVLFGGGVDVPMGSATFFLDGRYAVGLTNIFTVEGESIKTKGFQVALGARFPIGDK